MQIALMGYSRSGKDTVAELIRKHSKFPIAIVGFGDEMKELYTILFPKVDNHLKPREGYEMFAESCRKIHENVWVDRLDNKIKYLQEIALCNHFVINDLRQPNEWNWCFENGYTIIKVEADVNERIVRSFGDTSFKTINPSERNIRFLDYDFNIVNDGTLEELEQQVIQLLKIMEGSQT